MAREQVNIQLTNNTNAKFVFGALPGVEYHCAKFNLPGVSLGETPIANTFTTYAEPGRVTFNYLDISFLVDEDYKNWITVFDWMCNVGYSRSFNQFKSLKNRPNADGYNGEFSDAAVVFYNSNRMPNGVVANFEQCFPASLGDLDFDMQTSAPTPFLCNMRIQYQLYTIETPWRKNIK